jgi:hypothetical protein
MLGAVKTVTIHRPDTAIGIGHYTGAPGSSVETAAVGG